MTASVGSEEYRLCRGTLDFQEAVISSESISWSSSRPNHHQPFWVPPLQMVRPHSDLPSQHASEPQRHVKMTVASRGLSGTHRSKPGGAKDVPPYGQTRHGGGTRVRGCGRAVSQSTDLSSDVLKGGRADQGEAYQEHILGENQRDGWLRWVPFARSTASKCVDGATKHCFPEVPTPNSFFFRYLCLTDCCNRGDFKPQRVWWLRCNFTPTY